MIYYDNDRAKIPLFYRSRYFRGIRIVNFHDIFLDSLESQPKFMEKPNELQNLVKNMFFDNIP